MNALAALSISPLGGASVDADGSVAPAVAEIIALIRESGLVNETNAMFTNIEGPLEDVFELLEACTVRMTELAPRVSVVIKLDVRAGHEGSIRSKVARVEELVPSNMT